MINHILFGKILAAAKGAGGILAHVDGDALWRGAGELRDAGDGAYRRCIGGGIVLQRVRARTHDFPLLDGCVRLASGERQAEQSRGQDSGVVTRKG